jgi:hypothetical protein
MPVHQTIGYHRNHQYKAGVSHEPHKASKRGYDVDRPLTIKEAEAMNAACNVWLRKRGIPVLDFGGWGSYHQGKTERLKADRAQARKRQRRQYRQDNAYYIRPMKAAHQHVVRAIAKVARAITPATA